MKLEGLQWFGKTKYRSCREKVPLQERLLAAYISPWDHLTLWFSWTEDLSPSEAQSYALESEDLRRQRAVAS